MASKLRLKIAFLHDWDVSPDEQFEYVDGLRRALEVLAYNGHEVHYISGSALSGPLTIPYKGYTISLVPSDEQLTQLIERLTPSVIVCWGSLDRPWHQVVHDRFRTIPKVLCFAGGPRDHAAKSYFRVIVCESQVYIDDFTKAGVTAVRGFGTNVECFRPQRLPKRWDAIYPASLCFHKNLELFAKTFQSRGLCVGNHNEHTVASKILSFGTSLLHRVSSRTLCDLYNMSRLTVVTAGREGGAQRVVLESMACGIPVIVMSDHDRCVEFVQASGFGRVVHPVECEILEAAEQLMSNPMDPQIGRDYVTQNWSEYHYAESLMSAMEAALQ